MSYTITYNLDFNNDCEDRKILITDFFDEDNEHILDPHVSEEEEIVSVTIDYYKNACSSNCNNPEVYQTWTITDFESNETPYDSWILDEGVLSITSVGGINKIKITVVYKFGDKDFAGDDPRISITNSISHCTFDTCDVICCILNKLIGDIRYQGLANIFVAIQMAIDCNNCCLACELYLDLLEKIKTQNCKPCK